MSKERQEAFEQHNTETTIARQKLEQMMITREEVFRDTNMSDEERFARMQEIDMNRVRIIADNNTLFNEYSVRSTEGRTDGEYLELLKSSTKLSHSLSDEPFLIPPQSRIFEQKVAGPQGEPRFELYCEGSYIVDGKYHYVLRLLEPVDQTIGHRWHMALVQYDPTIGEVRTVVAPEAVWQERPRTLLPASDNLLLLRKEVTEALEPWIKKIKYNSRLDRDYAVEASGSYTTPPGNPIELKDEMGSTLMARDRKITPDTVDNLDMEIESLISSWRPDELRILQQHGGGNIRLRLFADYGEDVCDERYKECEMVTLGDGERLRNIVQEAFSRGAKEIIIKCYGSWVEREYRNLPPGTSPRTHLRRKRTGVELILNAKDRNNPEAIVLQNKFNRKNGGYGALDERERSLLSQLLSVGAANLDLYVTRGIIYKNGEFSPHPNEGPQGVYFYKKEEGQIKAA